MTEFFTRLWNVMRTSPESRAKILGILADAASLKVIRTQTIPLMANLTPGGYELVVAVFATYDKLLAVKPSKLPPLLRAGLCPYTVPLFATAVHSVTQKFWSDRFYSTSLLAKRMQILPSVLADTELQVLDALDFRLMITRGIYERCSVVL